MANGTSSEHSPWEKLQQKILASRFLTISLLMHILLVVFFGGTVLFNKYVEPPDFAAEGEGFLSSDAQVTPPTPDNPLDTQTPTFTVTPEPVAPTMTAITTTNPTVQSFTMNAMPVIAPKISNVSTERIASTSTKSMTGAGLPGTMSGRGSERRGSVLKQGGGKEKSDQAVVKALQWLRSVQNPDGTWGSSHKGAMTGLALLAFLGHGETQNSPEYGKTVAAGVDALLKAGAAADGRLSFSGKSFGRGAPVYAHAIATYALGEAYTMTKDERIVPVLTKAVGYITAGIRPDGGWAYAYDLDAAAEKEAGQEGNPKSDTSVSGWQVQALKAAKLTELPIEKVHETLDSAMNNFERVFDPKNGTFGYRRAGDRPQGQLAGVGVLCLTIGSEGKKDRYIREGLKAILRGPRVEYKATDANLYRWYYDTQACFMTKDKWGTWNQMFQDEIVNAQSPDGSWPPTGNPKALGGLESAGSLDGQVYRTTLCVLMLEVYYRYLPTSK